MKTCHIRIIPKSFSSILTKQKEKKHNFALNKRNNLRDYVCMYVPVVPNECNAVLLELWSTRFLAALDLLFSPEKKNK